MGTGLTRRFEDIIAVILGNKRTMYQHISA